MKLILNNKTIERIPVLEYYLDGYEHRGLVFVQHGYESTKEYGADYLAIALARNGYFVVSIDAYKHGERIEEPYISGSASERLDDAFIVVKRTAMDIIRLHHNFYIKWFPVFDIIGVSMGGMIAYYLATKCRHLRKLIPVISTPDFMGQAYHSVGMAGLNTDTFFDEVKLDFIKSIDPLSHVDKMQYESLHLFVGKNDPIVPMKASLEFFEEHKKEKDTCEIFEIDHNVPREMQLAIFTALEQ